jgi:carboxypeptidase C (cathepsin A)
MIYHIFLLIAFLIQTTILLQSTEFIEIEGKKLSYTSKVGSISVSLQDGKETISAPISYVAYFRESVKPRPLIFCFNGGPGSSSVWLHMGLLGPYTITNEQLTPNQSTLLPSADLVFVDPVGTGLSKPAEGVDPKPFYSVEGDISSLSYFIQEFLTEHNRWNAPLYLLGESYGGLRAIGIAAKLKEQLHIDTKGLILVSPAVDIATLDEDFLLAQVLQLPTLALTSQYYKLSAAEHQNKPISALYKEVVEFSKTVYAPALLKGESLDAQSKKNLYSQLASYTGIKEEELAKRQGKITFDFYKSSLFAKQGNTIGRFDTRSTSNYLLDPLDQSDPSLSQISGVFTVTFNDYLRNKLHYPKKDPYMVLQRLPWAWSDGQRPVGMGYLSLQGTLAKLFAIVPNFRLLLLSGYYDGATPIATQQYALQQLPENAQPSIQSAFYEGGHMMYLAPEVRTEVNSMILRFVK